MIFEAIFDLGYKKDKFRSDLRNLMHLRRWQGNALSNCRFIAGADRFYTVRTT